MRKDKHIGNNGSTFITVVVAVAFMAVLAAIIIAVSSANLQMKQIEYAAKKNFYTDEQILDDIYHGIGKVSAEYLARSYTEVLGKVPQAGETTAVYDTQEKAFQAFSNSFVERLKDKYGYGDETQDTLELLQSYITVEDPAKVVNPANSSIEVSSYRCTEVLPVSATDSTHFQYAFRDVVVKYRATDSKGAETGFESAITTDIIIEVPYINFFQDSSRILDYALIGNQGIYIDGGDGNQSIRTISGSVYAGISEASWNVDRYRDEGIYGGLNLYNVKAAFTSNYLISKGDINIRKSEISIGSPATKADTQVWTESIRTVENRDRSEVIEQSFLAVNGDLYVANDLELNARKSVVTLSGNYYGYNNGRYATWEKSGERAKNYEHKEHTQSSAIIINGNDSKLDMSRLKTLIISGVAYVDMASKAYSTTPLPLPSPITIEEYATGESLALKVNQYIYLAPSSRLTTTNPVKSSEAPKLEDVWVYGTGDEWFGFLGFVNPEKPVIPKNVVNNTTKEAYTYYYLNFEDGMKKEYANLVLNMQDPASNNGMKVDILGNEGKDSQIEEIWELKEALKDRVKNSGVDVVTVTEGTKAQIYSQGAMSIVSGEDIDPIVPIDQQISLDKANAMVGNMHTHYIQLYDKLNPQESLSMATPVGPDNPEALSANYPMAEFVDIDLLGAIASNLGEPYSYRDSHYLSIVSSSDVEINSNFNGIIISTGDVIIDGAEVNGLVIAGGKILIKGSGKIEANRSIVQAILDEEMREESKQKDGTAPNPDYVITYLKEIKVEQTGSDNSHRISGTDYTEYMSYENWRKGEGN